MICLKLFTVSFRLQFFWPIPRAARLSYIFLMNNKINKTTFLMKDEVLQDRLLASRPTITHRPTAMATSTLTGMSTGVWSASAANLRRRQAMAASWMRGTITFETNTRTRTGSSTATRWTSLLDVVQRRARKLHTRIPPLTGSSMARTPSPVSTSAITYP